jgi:hypothetical protein
MARESRPKSPRLALWTPCAITGYRNGGTSEETLRSPDHGSTAPIPANGRDNRADHVTCAGSSFFGYPASAARPPVHLRMAAWTKSLSFAAATPAFVRGRRSASPIRRFAFRPRPPFCRARSVPRAISRSRGSDDQLRAPVAASPTTPRLPTGIAYCPERYTSSGVRILSSSRQFCRPGPCLRPIA